MFSDEIKNIVAQFNEQGKMTFLDAATEEQIVEFEEENKVQLPSKYKEWLLFSDGGEFFLPAGVQLYGVAHKPLINIKDDDRPDDSYTVIGAFASGDPVLCQKDSEKIAVYDYEAGCIDDELIYEDFFTFLKDLYDLLG
ncbi:SMI1/KNR4 family protein [[Ruminococcus] torques]|uniref:SMI1/KNR4 family protein n=1 Tax=[Ruminococcus] torques TaxID=33039 RepID=UPI00243159DE|nr:SMI1/KNR4 family protein [[Ruminococcus] torques]